MIVTNFYLRHNDFNRCYRFSRHESRTLCGMKSFLSRRTGHWKSQRHVPKPRHRIMAYYKLASWLVLVVLVSRWMKPPPSFDQKVPVATWEYFPEIQIQSVDDIDSDLDAAICYSFSFDSIRPPPKLRASSGSSCDSFNGVLHIQQGPTEGDPLHVFFQSILAQLIWADQHNFLPWIHLSPTLKHVFDPTVHNDVHEIRFQMLKGMKIGWARDPLGDNGYKFPGKPWHKVLTPYNFSFSGNGIWEQYFQPVSSFSPGDLSCTNKPLVTFDSDQQIKSLDYFAPWTPRFPGSSTSNKLFQERSVNRMQAIRTMGRYIRFNVLMEQNSLCVLPNPEDSLGIHIESQKSGQSGNHIDVSSFLPFCKAFLENGGGDIYLVSNSPDVFHEIFNRWPKNIVEKIVMQQSVNSSLQMKQNGSGLNTSIHQRNVETLTDILVLSKCSFLLHHNSALAVAALYMNAGLIDRSVNLAQSERWNETSGILEYFVNEILPRGELPEEANWNYFPDIPEQSVKDIEINLDPSKCSSLILDASIPARRPPSQGACDGYNGILHIQQGDFGGASGTIFFQYLVGFLFWADQHNYKPWVHLNDFSTPIYDQTIHNQGPGVNFTMMGGMRVSWANDPRDPRFKFPGRPKLEYGRELEHTDFYFKGTGVWDHYFEPVSDFSPGDPSCLTKPLVELDYLQISQGLHAQAPWGVHAWRYWMPEYIQQPQLPFEDWFAPQRKNASRIVKRYIRFNAHMEQRAACAHPNPENSLGMHIRHGDKGIERYVIPVAAFLPYCSAFVAQGGNSIYLATDSALVVEEIMRDWPRNVTSRIVRQQEVKGLSRNDSAAFSLGVSAHQTNVEALTDALALSKCTYLLHGFSALTEAAFYLNPKLLGRSVNLDDMDQETEKPLISPHTFSKEILAQKENNQ
jgi:hypothetical protein